MKNIVAHLLAFSGQIIFNLTLNNVDFGIVNYLVLSIIIYATIAITANYLLPDKESHD